MRAHSFYVICFQCFSGGNDICCELSLLYMLVLFQVTPVIPYILFNSITVHGLLRMLSWDYYSIIIQLFLDRYFCCHLARILGIWLWWIFVYKPSFIFCKYDRPGLPKTWIIRFPAILLRIMYPQMNTFRTTKIIYHSSALSFVELLKKGSF